jgi:hypothetical protein
MYKGLCAVALHARQDSSGLGMQMLRGGLEFLHNGRKLEWGPALPHALRCPPSTCKLRQCNSTHSQSLVEQGLQLGQLLLRCRQTLVHCRVPSSQLLHGSCEGGETHTAFAVQGWSSNIKQDW